MAEKNEEKTLKDVMRMIFSHYRLFLAGSSLFTIAVLAASHYIPVKYTAVALFERRSDSAAESISNNPSESFQTMRLTMQQEMTGPKAVEIALEDLEVTKNWPRGADGQLTPDGQMAKQNLIAAVTKNLAIEWKVRSDQVDLIALTFNCGDPKLAEQIPNALIKRYITFAGESIMKRLKDSREFLKKQVHGCNARLVEMNNRKIEFESKYADLLLNGTTNLQDRIQEVYADVETLRRQQSLARQKVTQIEALVKSAKIKSLTDQVQQLKNEVDSCLTLEQMTTQHPKVQALQSKIARLEKRIQESRESEAIFLDGPGKDGIDGGMALQLASAESEVQIVSEEIERLQKRISTYKSVMHRSIPLREEYSALTKPLEDQQTATKRWQQRLTDVEMTIATEDAKRRTQLSAIQTAQKPTKPSFPPLWAIVAVAVGGGLLFGYGCALIASTLDHTLHGTQEAAKAFDVPVIGAIGKIETAGRKRLRQVRQTVVALTVALVVTAGIGLSTHSVMVR